jgi:hypothetical protein
MLAEVRKSHDDWQAQAERLALPGANQKYAREFGAKGELALPR